MKYNSIGMIETNGLVSSISALEAMLKLDDIEYIKSEIITNGQVTVFVSGDYSHLKHAVSAGKVAANDVGNVISTSIIEFPTSEILDLILGKKNANITQAASKKNLL